MADFFVVCPPFGAQRLGYKRGRAGVQQKELVNLVFEKGVQKIEFSDKDFIGKLSSSIYFYQATIGSDNFNGKIIKK